MSANASSVSTQNTPTHVEALPEVVNSTFEERWAAWAARGASDNRAFRRRVRVAAPILAVGAAVGYFLLVR
jgi:hypothetical protein